MTETAALTQEERAEIRALVEQCAWAGAKLDVSDVRSAIAATNLDAAAATISRLLDALEAAERERDALRDGCSRRGMTGDAGATTSPGAARTASAP
jgi:hypothetical protein